MTDREYVSEQLKLTHVYYETYLNIRDSEGSSAGMVVNYGGTGGGKTNRISNLTAQQAIRAAGFDSVMTRKLKWVDCVWSVFTHLFSSASKRERDIAYVLYHKALLGWTFARIAEGGLPSGAKVTRQCIYQHYDKAVDAVAEEAKKRDLLTR